MSASAAVEAGEVAAILALEQRRCRAEMDSDVAVLGAMLAEDFVYVHVSGTVDTKASILATRAVMKFAAMTRGDLVVHVDGDLATISGELSFRAQRVDSPDVRHVHAYATQVLRRRDGAWRFVLQQATLLRMTTETAGAGDPAASA